MSDTPESTPPPQAPPPAQPPAPAPQVRTPPADWKGPESAWFELDKARTKAREAETALEQERQRLAQERQKLQDDAAEARAQAARIQSQYERDTAILSRTDIPPAFRHPRMRERLWQEYESYRDTAGDKAVPFSDYIVSDDVKQDPLYAAHFVVQPDPSAPPPIPQPAAPAPGAPATGTVLQPQGAPVQYTQAMINRLRAEGQWRAGRIDTTTGEPIGGSPHWQAYMRSLSKR